MKSSSLISRPCSAVSVGALGVLCALVACTTPAPNENFNARDKAGSGGAGAGGGGRSGESGGGGRSGSSGGGSGGSSGSGGTHALDGGLDGSDPFDGGGPLDGGEDLGMPDGLRACGSAPVSSDPFTARADLRAAAADCAMWHYCEFENQAAWLAHLIGKHAEEPSDYRLERARQAWREAMASWSKVELFQFGPLPSPVPSAGKDEWQGKSFRDRIYSWPTFARCRVEEQVALRAYEDGFDRVLISARGLLALEYLLFYEGDDTECAASSATSGEWSELSSEEVQDRKLAYAQAVANDLLELARGLSDAWSEDGDDFRATFIAASGYPNEQEAMNVLGWSLAYVDKELDDWKIGVPAGRTATSPVTGPESPYANVATANWSGNLRGFRSLFQGCGANGQGIGFDDWLEEAGHEQLADDIVSAWQAAQAEIDALPPLDQASEAQLIEALETLRVLTMLLKSNLLGAGSPLNLQLPATLASDTD